MVCFFRMLYTFFVNGSVDEFLKGWLETIFLYNVIISLLSVVMNFQHID